MGHNPRKISVRWDRAHLTHPVIDMYVRRLSSVKLGKKINEINVTITVFCGCCDEFPAERIFFRDQL